MTTAEDVLSNARRAIGYVESAGNRTIYGEWYGMQSNPWCAMALSKWTYDAGLPIPATTSKGYAYCPSGLAYFKRMGWLSTKPSVGAHVYFAFPGEGSFPNHVGIVEKIMPDGSIQTIEANTSDRVMRRSRRGNILAYGHPPYGASPKPVASPVHLNAPVVEVLTTPSGLGYWQFAEDGGVFAFGDAPFFGSMAGRAMNAPIVGAAAHPRGSGYWLVGADGGIFNFGTAKFFGSMGGRSLNAPMRGVTAHPSGDGYWLAAADGGVFAFGAAKFHGSPYDFSGS